jgi:invasion protein IalB
MEHQMTRPIFLLAFALCLGVFGGTAAPAQEATAPAEGAATEAPADPANPAADLSLGSVEGAPDGVGTSYTPATFDAWEQRCLRTADGSDPCQLYQLLKDSAGNSVAEVSIFGLPPGQQAAAGATIVVPLETLLTEQLTMAVDAAPAKRYPFSWCASVGCFARIGFTPDEVAALKRGAKAVITIVPVAAPDQKVSLDMSLAGFTAGFDAVNAANAQ